MNILIAVLPFLLAGICSGETCKCMSYLISEDGLSNENQISSIDFVVENITCDGNGAMKCKDFCVEMYQELTENGKLCVKMPGSDNRVGDWMCEYLKRDVYNGRIGVFAKSCGSDALDTGFRFIENLNCKSGHSIQC